MIFVDGFAPPPLDFEYIPTATESFCGFMLAYLLLVMLVLWMLPTRWTRWVFFQHDEK